MCEKCGLSKSAPEKEIDVVKVLVEEEEEPMKVRSGEPVYWKHLNMILDMRQAEEWEWRKALLDFVVIVSSLGSNHRNQIADDLRDRFLS